MDAFQLLDQYEADKKKKSSTGIIPESYQKDISKTDDLVSWASGYKPATQVAVPAPIQKPQDAGIVEKITSAISAGVRSALSSVSGLFGKEQPIVSPIPEVKKKEQAAKVPLTTATPVIPQSVIPSTSSSIFDTLARVAVRTLPFGGLLDTGRQQREIAATQDYLAKNYDSVLTKTLAYVQQKAEEDFKKRPETYTFTRAVTSFAVGGTKQFSDYYNTEVFTPKDLFGKARATAGEVAGTLMVMHLGGQGLKAIGAARATLPILFASIGQLTAPYDTTIKQRLLKLPKDLLTGWLFGKVPQSEKLLSLQTVKGAIPAGALLATSQVAENLIAGLPPKEAGKGTLAAFVIGALFHTTGVAQRQFTGAQFRQYNPEMTPDQIRAQVNGTNLNGTKAGKDLLGLAQTAEIQGKNVQFEVTTAKPSPLARVVGKGIVEQLTGKPQEIKFKTGEGADVIMRVQLVDPKKINLISESGVPTPKEPVAPATRQTIPLETKQGVKGAVLNIRPDGTAGVVIQLDKSQQGQGIGRELVQQGEQKAREAGVTKMTSSAFVETQGFWEKQGYTVVQGAQPENGMIDMEKDITLPPGGEIPKELQPFAQKAQWEEKATPALDLKIGEQIRVLEPSGKEKLTGTVKEISRTPEYVNIKDDVTGNLRKIGFGFEFRREVIATQRIGELPEKIKLGQDIPDLDAQVRTIEKPTKEDPSWTVEVGLQESLGEQGGDILTLRYDSEPTIQEIRTDILDEYKAKKAEINKEVAAGIVAKSGRDEMIEKAIDKVLASKLEVQPVQPSPKKTPQVSTGASLERIRVIKGFFEGKYGKPIEKGTAKEINEMWVATESLPIIPESEPIYKKVTSAARGIRVSSFETYPNLLFGGIQREMFTDGYVMITDKTVAGEINKKFVESWEKDYIKSLQRSNSAIPYSEAEKLAKENTGRLIEYAKTSYPDAEKMKKIIPSEWGKSVVPLGFQPNGTAQTFVFLSDENYEVAVSGDKLVAMQKYLPDATIHLSGTLTPVVFVQNGKLVGVLMPINLSNGKFPEEFSRVKEKKEEPKTEAPAYTGGKEGAAVGKFAELENLTKQQKERPDLPSFRAVPFPEIVRIVKNLTGKVPQIKKRMYYMGKAFPEGLGINLKAMLFKDPIEAAKTLSHELGHITDYLPEKDQRKGNLLGRIASLKGYFKHWLSDFPGGLGKILTDKEKRQFRKEAEKLAQKPVTETKEVVIAEKLPSPKEILNIWRTNTSNIDTPELLAYIQRLPDELKADIVKAALKSTVPKWITFKNQVKETVTVGVIRNAPEDIRRLYKNLLHKEILKRRLIELKTVRQELQALSAIWRPFDRLKSSTHYVQYRDKPTELYADAISVLYNDPERLKIQAPEFYRGFFNYLNQKPEVAEEYYQIQHLLSRESDEVNKERLDEMYKGFDEGAAKRKEAFNKKIDKKSLLFRGMTQHVTKFYPIYRELNKAIKEGKITMDRKQVIRETLEEMAYKRNDVWLDLERNETEVMEPLAKVGISEKELGAWFTLERNLGDRLGIANPGGLIGDFNKEVKEYLAKNFTKEQSDVLTAAVQKFHDATFEIAQEMYNEGMIPEKVFKEKIEPYKNSYVTYTPVKHIVKNYVTPYVKEMIGTLEEIENPLVTTMYKRSSMKQALLVHKAKTGFVSVLKEISPDEIPISKSVMGIKHQRIYQKAPDKGQLVLLEKGKWVSYDIDPYFEVMFKQFDPKDLHSLAFLAGQFNKYFKPVVTTYKLGWAAYNNPIRDVQRTLKNLAAISQLEGIKFDRVSFLRDWIASIPEGFKFSGGTLTPLAKEALGAHAISTPWVSYDPTAGEDKALYTLYQKYRFFGKEGDPKIMKRITQKFLLPIEIVLRSLERIGGTFESTTKLAGFKYLSQRLEDQGKVGFYTRNYVGTPNYLEGGAMKEIDNSIWVFSNVIIQSFRSESELLRNPKSRGAWVFESFLQSGIWKLLMLIGASGFLGKEIKDAYDKMTEYHKSNFLAFPIVMLPNGRALYVTVPQDETNRLSGAIMWKIGMALQGKLTKPQQVLQIGAGFAPSMTPIFDVIGAWFDYAKGINPWDSYYGRNVLDQQTARARGVEGVKKMALWSLNQVGLGNFATYDPATKTTFEKFIQYTPLINRIFKVSDYGMVEKELEVQAKETQQRAVQNIKEAKLVTKYVDEYTKQGGDPNEFKDKLESALYPNGPDTSEDKANLTRLQKDFDQEILARQGDTRIKTIMKLRFSTTKVNALKGFAKEMETEKYMDLLNTLLDAKVISEDVYDKALE